MTRSPTFPVRAAIAATLCLTASSANAAGVVVEIEVTLARKAPAAHKPR